MPELPEVETVRLGLSRLIIGLEIRSVSFDWPKSFPNAPSDVNQFLIGAKIVAVRRRAKVLLIDLSTNYTLVTHLKMTGQMVFVPEEDIRDKNKELSPEPLNSQVSKLNSTPGGRWGAGHPNDSLIGILPDKSTRVFIGFVNNENGLEPATRKLQVAEPSVSAVHGASSEAGDKVAGQERWTSFGLCSEDAQRGPSLYFNDQRKFGWMRLMPTIQIEEIDFFKKVGPEPLESTFSSTLFSSQLDRRKNTSIKAALLDQTVLAGIGNIYADESLWGALIHPSTKVGNVSLPKRRLLHKEIVYVLTLAIEKGGSTNRNYVNAEGKKGSYMDFARVFRRENLPCPRCSTALIKLKVAGRGTHICPKCQRLKT